MTKSDLEELVASCACGPGEIESPGRLRLLKQSGLLEGRHPRLERLTGLCSSLLSVPTVLVSLVDIDRQVFPSHQGLSSPWKEAGETPLTHSVCQHVVTSGEPLVTSDVRVDVRLRENSNLAQLGVVAYAGFPISCEHQVLGSFCAIHPRPHEWSFTELRLIRQFAETVSDQIEQKLEYDELKLALTNLREANEELENMAEILAHDLKAPLRGVRNSLYLLESSLGELTPESQGFLENADSSAQRMSQLIDTLSDFSSALFTSGEADSIDLDSLLDDVLADLAEEISEKSGQVNKESRLGETCGFRPLVHQVFQNLIANGLKFQPAGRAPVIKVGQRESDGAYFVSDNGMGIPIHLQDKIFGLYSRGPEAKSYPGSGLGLAICARAVSKHNGRLWVESEPNVGSTFFFTLRMRGCQSEG